MALIHIAGNTYELIFENRNGWNVEAFRNRYSEVLDRYDYIVGDWGYNQLRLKGFFRDGHQKATKDSTFSYMTDYINEYCNFGCAYFILEKKQGSEALETSDEDIFIEEIEYTRPIPVPKEPKDKSATVSAAEEGAAAGHKEHQPQRSKRAASREKQGNNDSSSEDGSHEKPRSRNQRQGSKQQHGQQDKSESNQDAKQEHKKDGKPKRKDFHRKGPRPFDKKNKGNKGQTEKVSSATTTE